MKFNILELKNFVLDLIFPVFCLNCRMEGGWLCNACIRQVYFKPPTCFVCKKINLPTGRTCKNCRGKTKIYAFLSPLFYDNGPVKDLIHYLKYRRVRSISNVLAGLAVDYINKYKIAFLVEDLVVVPIPLYKSRRAERGFNQAELIAKDMASILKLKINCKLLIKDKKTRFQMELSGVERKNNLVGVFKVVDPEKVKDKNFLLLDDVKTTGATLEEAAKTLKQAGARKVWAVTIAS